MLDKFKEEVLIDNLIALCVGEKDIKAAKKDLKKNCGLSRDEFTLVSSIMFSKNYTDYLLEQFAIASCKKPKLLEMYLRSGSDEWIDVFCYEGTILSLLECAAGFKSTDDCLCSAYAKIAELENTVKTLEIKAELINEGLCLPSSMFSRRSKDKPKQRNFVYFMQAGDFCKIGFTKDVEARISQLQIGSPVRLQLLHLYEPTCISAMCLEKLLHEHFKHERYSGEWFCIDTDISALEELCCRLDK